MAGQEVSFVEENNPWSVFILEDGTRLKVRPILIRVTTTNNKLADGQPAYNIHTQLIIDQAAPEKAVLPSKRIIEP